jgi:membrane protein
VGRSAEAVDAFQRRHRWVGLPLATFYKYNDDRGGYLAALITYYGFLSLFPLLLLLTTILNFVLAGDAHLQQRVLNSALGQFPIVGTQLRDPHGVSGSGVGLAIGIVGTLYGGLGIGQAFQYAMNTIWRVPNNSPASVPHVSCGPATSHPGRSAQPSPGSCCNRSAPSTSDTS